MSFVTISPNMGLPVPDVGQEPGPAWAQDVNSCMGILDQHNHTSGQGVPITPAGMNINVDLPFNGNNAVSLRTVRFTAQLMSLPGSAPDLGCIYVAGNELYYNDEAGNVVQLTNNGNVNSGAGSITGLPSGTASASYSAGPGTFVWQSATNTAANMDFASATFRDQTPGSNGVTINAPASLAANYDINLFTALPGSTKLVSLDSSGNLGYADADGTQILFSGGVLSISPTANITNSQLAPANIQISPSSGGFSTNSTSFTPVTNLATTITTVGQPVFIALQGSTASGGGEILWSNESTSGALFMSVKRDGTIIGGWNVNSNLSGTDISYPPPFLMIDILASAGSHTYTIEVQISPTSASDVFVTNCQLVTYEIA